VDKIQEHENQQQNGGISEEYYYNLLAEYGKKFMQTLILLEEINRLNVKVTEIREHLEKAEEYYYAYEWGKYYIVILPPSFPFGGMENPLLTFASPSIIVGDKSEISVA